MTSEMNDPPGVFRSRGAGTIGIELECQIIDPRSCELAPGALRVLEICRAEALEGVSEEFLLSMLEVKTGVCRNMAEARDSLCGLLHRTADIARSVGYELSVGGTHPNARPAMSAIYPDERYAGIRDRQGWFAYQESIFGLHVHVGVPNQEAAIGVMNAAVPYLPHLLALSANSPMWEGIDTEHASARGRMFRPSAISGIPPHFAGWHEYLRYCRIMREAGALRTSKEIYWDLRPRPDLGTVEFRIFDAPKSFEHLLSLAALVRIFVLKTLRDLEDDPQSRQTPPEAHWLAEENRMLASRYGLAARCARMPENDPVPLADDLSRLVSRLSGLAAEWDELEYLQALEPLDRFKTGAEEQRAVFRRTGRWQAVVEEGRRNWFGVRKGSIQEQAPSVIYLPSTPAILPAHAS
jgi:carboxylate-amine ligase